MGRSRSGYSSYRGRRTLHDILKGVAILLLILVILFLGILFFAPEPLSLPQVSLPFSREETPDPGDISLVIQPAGAQEETPEETPPEETPPAMFALELPLEAVLDGSAPSQLEAAGANALILDMKNEEGQLGWISQQALAVRSGACAQADGINEALRQWNQGEIYTVARVCCFRDNTIPYYYNNMALRISGGNWRDELGLRWLNPGSADVHAYLASLCAELADLGFDEILLDSCGFPTQGRLDSITTQITAPSQAIEDFLSQVRTALEPYGTVLSVRTDEAALTGEDTLSGLTAACLEASADRLWLEENDGTAELLETAGITGGSQRLTRIVSALNPEENVPQAVFPEAREP